MVKYKICQSSLPRAYLRNLEFFDPIINETKQNKIRPCSIHKGTNDFKVFTKDKSYMYTVFELSHILC